MIGGEILIEGLKAQGIRCLVGMPGTQNSLIYDCLLRRGGIDHYLIRNEQAATLVASGFARASGEVGVALTVPGPGSTNASTGLGDACADCVPVLLITGGTEVAHDGRDRSKCFHGLDQAAFFAPITRFYARPRCVEEIPAALTGAFRALRAPRPGPAVIDLPADVAAATADVVQIPVYVEGERPAPAAAAIKDAAALLGRCQRPAILAGGNVLGAGASGELRQLAEAWDVPVALTRLGKGALADGHPLCAEHCEGPLGRSILESADGVLALGCRFTQIDTAAWTMQLPTPLVQFDPDPGEIGREFPVDGSVVGDLKQSLPLLLDALRTRKSLPSGWGTTVAQRRREKTAHRPPLPLMAAMRRLLEPDAIVAADVTAISYRAFDEFPVYQPRTFLYPCHYVTLGFGVPAAIGARLAHPDRQVVAFCGDGGFQMTAYELATAAEHRIQVVFVVVNDGSLSAIRGSQVKEFDGRTIDTDMHTPHLADLARAMGVRGIRVEEPERFAEVFAASLQQQGPTLIEVMMEEQRDELIRRVPWIYPD